MALCGFYTNMTFTSTALNLSLSISCSPCLLACVYLICVYVHLALHGLCAGLGVCSLCVLVDACCLLASVS